MLVNCWQMLAGVANNRQQVTNTVSNMLEWCPTSVQHVGECVQQVSNMLDNVGQRCPTLSNTVQHCPTRFQHVHQHVGQTIQHVTNMLGKLANKSPTIHQHVGDVLDICWTLLASIRSGYNEFTRASNVNYLAGFSLVKHMLSRQTSDIGQTLHANRPIMEIYCMALL